MNRHLRRMIAVTVFVAAFCASLFISTGTASAVVLVEKDGSQIGGYDSFAQAVAAVNENENIKTGDSITFEVDGAYPGAAPAFEKRIDLEIYGTREGHEFHRYGEDVLSIKDAASVYIHDLDIRCSVRIQDSRKEMEVTMEKVNVFTSLTIEDVSSCSIDGTKENGSRSIIQTFTIKGSYGKRIQIEKIRGIESVFQYGDDLPDYVKKQTKGYRINYADCALIENCQVTNGWVELNNAAVQTFTGSRVINQVDILRAGDPAYSAVDLTNSVIELMENCTVVSYIGQGNGNGLGYAMVAKTTSIYGPGKAIGTMRNCYIYGSYDGIVLGNSGADMKTIDNCVIAGREAAIVQQSSPLQFSADIDCIKGNTVLFSISSTPVLSGGYDRFEPNLTKAVGDVRIGTVSGGSVPGGDKSTWPEGYSWRNTNRNLSVLVTPEELSPYVLYDLTEFYYLSYDQCMVTYHEGAGSKKDGFDAHYQEVLPGGATYTLKAYDSGYIDVPDPSLLNDPMGWTEDVDGEGDVLYGGASVTITRRNYDYYPKYADNTTYRVVFDTGEYGSKVEPQQVFRQLAPKTPEEPTHPGAAFKGWYLDDQFSEAYVFSSPISGRVDQNNTVKLYAKWELNEYTVTFNASANGGNPDRAVTVKWGEKVEPPAEEPEYKEPGVKSFTGWYKTAAGKTEFDFDTVIKKDTTVYACFAYNKSTITIEMDGGAVGGVRLPWKNIGGNIVYKGEAADRIPVPWGENTTPAKDYMYTYGGLYEDPEFKVPFAFEGDEFIVPATRSYYVRFVPKDYTVKYYDVSYEDYQKDTSVRPIKEELRPYGSEITYESEEPARFGGWDPYYVHNSETIPVNNWNGTVLAYEMKLFLIDNPQVIYHSDIAGTKVMEKAYARAGSSLADYGNREVECEDYTFVGWTTEPRTDGEYHYKETLPDEGKPDEDQENYPCVGFFDFENSVMPDEDLHLYPVLVRDRLRVRLNPNGGRMMAGQAVEFTVDINEKLEMRLMNRTLNPGYVLDGWYTQTGVKWNADWGVTPEYCAKDDDGKPVRKEEPGKNYHYYTIGLNAIWSPKEIDVCFKGIEPNYDVLHKEGTVRLGDTVVLKDAVTTAGGYKVFVGWMDKKLALHSGGEEFLFDDAGLLDDYDRLVFTAHHRDKDDSEHVIRFDTQGGSYVPPITLAEGASVTAPADPVREGYVFEGWNPEVPDTMPVEDMACTAQWKKEARKFTISFDTTGGSAVDPITAEEGSALTPPSDPEREHYLFKGWTPAFPAVMPSKDRTFSATWEPAVYKVTFDANGGNFRDGKQKTEVNGIYNAVLTAPEDPVRDQYEFSGWESDVPSHIPGGDITIKATWTKTDQDDPEDPTPAPAPTHQHKLTGVAARAATCTQAGHIGYYKCSGCGKLFKDAAATTEIRESDTIISATGHQYGAWTRLNADQHQRVCAHDRTHVEKENHTWDAGRVTRKATASAAGIRTYTCTVCKATRTETIPKLAAGSDPNQKGRDGTAVGPGASAAAAEKAIVSMKKDTDPKGAVFSKLKLRSPRQTKTSVSLKWTKVKKAKKYVIYGNKCGKTTRPKKLVTVTGSTKVIKKAAGKKLKKGTYYKFIIVALDKNNNVVSTSKLIHVATKGGKVGNHKSVTVKAKAGKKLKKISKVSIKKGKSLKLRTRLNPQSKKYKVRKHVGARYESTNRKIATVSGKGKITAKAKGTCSVYVYAQNGVFKKITVTVR